MNRSLFFLTVICLGFFSCANPLPQQADGMYAIIETNRGDIVAELEFEKAPLTVANFVGLAEGSIENTFREPKAPFYDGLTFHRVEKPFVIQGGDPLGTGMGDPGYKFRQEINPDLAHSKPGTLSMAHAGPGTNGSQFFITHVPTPHLDGGYNVFGYVIGQPLVLDLHGSIDTLNCLDIVNQIQRFDTIRHIEIIRKGSAAQNFNAAKTFMDLKNN